MQKKISFVLLILIIILVFRKYFLPGPLVYGDAPYFYKEGLKELVNLLSPWISRGNSLGGVNLFLWIYPIMALYGFLGSFVNLNNDIILRILFYLPSLFFGFWGVYLLTRYLTFSSVVQFFSILIYLFNTYYFLLIDGGQVGVVLAYGLFPLVLYLLIKTTYRQNIRNFLIALISSFILTIVDFRISAICILTVFILRIFQFRKLWVLVFMCVLLLGLSSYWIVPALTLPSGALSYSISGLQTTSLVNSLFLSSPNWPTNEFGKTIAPYFYFGIIPILVFLPIFFVKEKRIVWLTFVFLFFAFLTKGASDPLGFFYRIGVSSNFGSVFRDSTKFFIPLILIGGILIGIAIETLSKKFKYSYLQYIIYFIVLLILVWQGIFGKLNGVLGKNPDQNDYQKIYKLISNDKTNFFRDIWFIEKSPFAFHTEEKQALDAKDLVNFRPFASMNVGTGDKFNFVNNKTYLDFFNLLGIKYLIFNGNPRVKSMNETDQKDWARLMGLIQTDTRLKTVELGTNIPIYENLNIHPNKFFVDKTYLVVGADDIYEKFKNINNNFSVGNQGFLFLEDGRFDPTTLQNIASTSAVLIFNNKTEDDLKMSFLQSNFISPSKSYYSQWAIRKPDDYLNWKYELLINNIDTKEFDYNRGVAFSSQPNEEIKYNLNALQDGDYYIALRSMEASGSGDLNLEFNGSSYLVKRSKNNQFEWFIKGPINLKQGNYSLSVKNNSGFQVVNVVSLIYSNDLNDANGLTKNFLSFFDHFNLSDISTIPKNNWVDINNAPQKPGWIIYTDSFNKNWSEQNNGADVSFSYPMYSMINGFYTDPKWTNSKIIFKGNEDIRWGIYFSTITILVIVIFRLWILSR